jgi:hypothetical protein
LLAHRGFARLELRQYEPALADLQRALDLRTEAGANNFTPFLLALAAIAEAGLGRDDAADASMAEAERTCEQSAPAIRASVRAARGVLERTRATTAVARGDAAAAAQHDALARSIAEELRCDPPQTDRPPASVPLAMRVSDVRILARMMLPHASAPDRRDAPAVVPAAATPAFVVHERGDWFRGVDGATVECTRRPVQRRLLASLVKARRRAPGEPVPFAQLIAEIWPGERIIAAAALNRLRVAVNALRALGFRETLCIRDGGYYLDPAVQIQVVAPRGRPGA